MKSSLWNIYLSIILKTLSVLSSAEMFSGIFDKQCGSKSGCSCKKILYFLIGNCNFLREVIHFMPQT